jgi:hypothetical protein
MIVTAYRGPNTGPVEEAVHVVGGWQWFAAAMLGRKAPLALCGLRLTGDRDQVDVALIDEPMCSSCIHEVAQALKRRWWR